MRSIVGAVLAVLTAGSALAQPLEFKGIVLGTSTADEVLKRYPGALVTTSEINALMVEVLDKKCGGRRYSTGSTSCEDSVYEDFELPGGYRFASIHFDVMPDQTIGGVWLSFSRNAFPLVRDALVSKYGEPSIKRTDEVKSGAGAIFESQYLTWRRTDGQINLRERFGRITDSWLEIITPQMRQQKEQDHKRRVQEGVKKL